MARMHSRDKGKSGSKKPIEKKVPEWVSMKPEEAEKLVVELANLGHTESNIGMILRDQHGVPSVKVLTGKRIGAIFEANKLASDIPRDMLNLIRKSVNLQKHMAENKKDMTSKRGYQLTVSKIRRLSRYYIKEGKLPVKWRYTPEKAALLVK